MDSSFAVLLSNYRDIISILSQNQNLDFSHSQLPIISDKQIKTPAGNILRFFSNKLSNLPNENINFELLKKLIFQLTDSNSLVRLSHIGFCYKVPTLIKEKSRIIELAKKSSFDLYQENSNDDGLWFFIGNAQKWEDPVIELIPIESTADKYVDYWLPHIQIDIDTKLTGLNIIEVVESVFGKRITPYPIKIDGITYIVRNRLGVIDGVNIFLDLATNSRRVKYLRRKLWKKIA